MAEKRSPQEMREALERAHWLKVRATVRDIVRTRRPRVNRMELGKEAGHTDDWITKYIREEGRTPGPEPLYLDEREARGLERGLGLEPFAFAMDRPENPHAEVPAETTEARKEEPSPAGDEVEWLRGRLSETTKFRLWISGDFGVDEIGKLILLLETQRAILENPESPKRPTQKRSSG